jgi:hypothetical protein
VTIAPSLWQRVFPFVGLMIALLINVLWIGLLGYALILLH